jgi:riboflavin synthase
VRAKRNDQESKENVLFTGIVEEVGTLRSLRKGRESASLIIAAPVVAQGVKIGDSVAVSGVCLTVTSYTAESFSCDLSAETLQRSSFDDAAVGKAVNLERALQVGSRLGGHFVQGHVDGIGRLVASTPSGDGALITFSFPKEIERYLVYKGSIAVDGISLTIAALKSDTFTVAIIPHSLKTTTLGRLRTGDAVNLETDILAKYFERYFSLGLEKPKSGGLTVEYLKEQGF